jgi:hypothetical protein
MRTSLLIGIIVAICLFIGVGSAAADSRVRYNDGSFSDAYFLGSSGLSAFVFYDIAGDGDIFIHAINALSNLLPVSVFGVPGYGFWFDFRGSSGGCLVYDVFSCTSPVGQVCTVSGTYRGSVCF